MKTALIRIFFLVAATTLAAQTVPESSPAGTERPVKAESFSALLRNSPFKPVHKNAINAKKTLNTNFQFRGLLTIAGETEFGIYDAQAQRCYWLKLRERHASGIVVENYSDGQKMLTVQTPAGRQVLALASPEEKPLNNTMRTVLAAPVTNTSEANQNNQKQQRATATKQTAAKRPFRQRPEQ